MFHLLEETVDLQRRLRELSGLLASSNTLLLHNTAQVRSYMKFIVAFL